MTHDKAHTPAPEPGGGGGQEGPASRRKFLRQFGATAVFTTAAIGMAEATGLGAASAAVKKGTVAAKGATVQKGPALAQRKAVASAKVVRHIDGTAQGVAGTAQAPAVTADPRYYATCDPGHCGGPCPKGSWCYYYWTATSGAACDFFSCRPGGCYSLELSAWCPY